MDGPMAGVVPDVVEQEVGNFLRTLYKLEKEFVDVPAAKKIAAMVRFSLSVSAEMQQYSLLCIFLCCPYLMYYAFLMFCIFIRITLFFE